MESQPRDASRQDTTQSRDSKPSHPQHGDQEPGDPQPGDLEQIGPHPSAWSQVLGVLFSPSKTFEHLAAKPSWVLPLILTVITGVALSAVVLPMIDWPEVVRAQIEASGQSLSEAQIEQQIGMVEKFGAGFAWVAAVAGPFVVYPGLALIFWLIFKVMGSTMSFRQSLSVLLHGYAPIWLVSVVLSIPVVLAQGGVTTEQVQSSSYLLSNLGFLATEDTHVALRSILTSLDLFSFWTLILLSIGYRIVARVSGAKATVSVVALWLIYVLGKTGLQMIGQAFS